MDKAQLAKLRYRARTDLFWLETEILGATEMVPRVHQSVADFFVHKLPGKTIAEQDHIKQRALYDPRGHFKTTTVRADIVQWLINFPDIRIFLGSGKLDQASDSLVAVKEQFQTNKKLRALFPECCPPTGEEWGNLTSFTLPNRTKVLAEPSVLAFSLDSIKAGPHCDILYLDDAVHQDNIGSPQQRANTITRFNYLRPIPEPFGYVHVIGTPYIDDDLYSWLEDNAPRMKKHRRPVWKIVNPNHEEGQELKESDVELLFPERFTFEWLNEIRLQNPYLFNCQYLLDPSPVDQVTFTEDLIVRHTIPHSHIPKAGSVFQTWDLAFTTNAHSDYSCGATGLFDTKGNLFILDVVLGKFSPHELVNQIAQAALKWRPRKIGIEDAGSKLILPSLDLIQRQYGRNFNLDWLQTSPLKRKPERILSLQPLLKQDRLYLSAGINPAVMEQLKKQFVKFPRFSHDDGPDAISMLLHYRGNVDFVSSDRQYQEDTISVSFNPSDDNLLGAGLTG